MLRYTPKLISISMWQVTMFARSSGKRLDVLTVKSCWNVPGCSPGPGCAERHRDQCQPCPSSSVPAGSSWSAAPALPGALQCACALLCECCASSAAVLPGPTAYRRLRPPALSARLHSHMERWWEGQKRAALRFIRMCFPGGLLYLVHSRNHGSLV